MSEGSTIPHPASGRTGGSKSQFTGSHLNNGSCSLLIEDGNVLCVLASTALHAPSFGVHVRVCVFTVQFTCAWNILKLR